MAQADRPTDQPTDQKPSRRGLPRRRTRQTPPATDEDLALARRIVDLAADKKAADIVLLQVGALTTLADYFVICSGGSERQIGAIADGVAEGLRAEGVRPIGREGSPDAHWLLLDFGSVIVHVMAAPERDFYQLERLWADAPLVVRVQ
jgi:ribosome-associated protein